MSTLLIYKQDVGVFFLTWYISQILSVLTVIGNQVNTFGCCVRDHGEMAVQAVHSLAMEPMKILADVVHVTQQTVKMFSVDGLALGLKQLLKIIPLPK